MAKALVYITYKSGVLDPQGLAVKGALTSLGFGNVNDVRVGKYIEIELEDAPPEELRAEAEKMCAELLANPVIENYRVELPGDADHSDPPAPGT
ncbi:MAG: phosphoribosylformylglycinamidine synthase subunit PurS [Nitrospinaceae bacterium]|nr:phosphoribosylformylglycinamidine synthase subunit PurS [Nitrospinaceae bacterium]MBT3435790.1 phosphoribosylformylglycinamidine synthase subunit PurS [Nitrospinaceae bacterium]MBT3819834.1 phosphoribosylformylglycinamidine synthase subunit PurS [Nitrospinaceae bacterium]MBT4092500.1 phosphoribosylformylglycinamidine synthase subunit PurS [Nitrospinaceae bacterium]MBT4430356.1 phosphoribosylformylglycinamidine synthase subunit PurS [Nitrospinaceae bacterium]